MRINFIEFKEFDSGRHLEKTFFNDLNLLVGASGVGKTYILRILQTMKLLATNSAMISLGISWRANFETDNGNIYEWSGTIESSNKYIDNYNVQPFYSESDSTIIKESIKLNHKEIAFRNNGDYSFKNKKLPKLNSKESLIWILKEEELITPIYEGLKKILVSNLGQQTNSEESHYLDKNLVKSIDTIEKIRSANLGFLTKLFLTYKNDKDTFNKIVDLFKEVFPNVENIEIKTLEELNIASFNENQAIVLIKEKGVKNWIPQSELSAGMLKALIHLSEIMLCPNGSILLIDEFENSLGFNCIDEVTDAILNSDRKIQFILTSHHPYIINNIHLKHWKLVTRNGSKIETRDSGSLNLGKSRHEAYTQLIQLKAYRTGIAS